MIPAIGPKTAFSDGVALTQPSPISHNVNRAAVNNAAVAKVGTLKHDLTHASVGIPAYSIDSLRPGRIIDTKA